MHQGLAVHGQLERYTIAAVKDSEVMEVLPACEQRDFGLAVDSVRTGESARKS
jgi:hypothetical protein